jgi:hypothetical protein
MSKLQILCVCYKFCHKYSFVVVASGMSDFCISHVRVCVLIDIKYIFVYNNVYKNYESQTSFINSPAALFGH